MSAMSLLDSDDDDAGVGIDALLRDDACSVASGDTGDDAPPAAMVEDPAVRHADHVSVGSSDGDERHLRRRRPKAAPAGRPARPPPPQLVAPPVQTQAPETREQKAQRLRELMQKKARLDALKRKAKPPPPQPTPSHPTPSTALTVDFSRTASPVPSPFLAEDDNLPKPVLEVSVEPSETSKAPLTPDQLQSRLQYLQYLQSIQSAKPASRRVVLKANSETASISFNTGNPDRGVRQQIAPPTDAHSSAAWNHSQPVPQAFGIQGFPQPNRLVTTLSSFRPSPLGVLRAVRPTRPPIAEVDSFADGGRQPLKRKWSGDRFDRGRRRFNPRGGDADPSPNNAQRMSFKDWEDVVSGRIPSARGREDRNSNPFADNRSPRNRPQGRLERRGYWRRGEDNPRRGDSRDRRPNDNRDQDRDRDRDWDRDRDRDNNHDTERGRRSPKEEERPGGNEAVQPEDNHLPEPAGPVLAEGKEEEQETANAKEDVESAAFGGDQQASCGHDMPDGPEVLEAKNEADPPAADEEPPVPSGLEMAVESEKRSESEEPSAEPYDPERMDSSEKVDERGAESAALEEDDPPNEGPPSNEDDPAMVQDVGEVSVAEPEMVHEVPTEIPVFEFSFRAAAYGAEAPADPTKPMEGLEGPCQEGTG
jgi:hypothetical protein